VSDKDILERSIQKAIDGGWISKVIPFYTGRGELILKNIKHLEEYSVEHIIYNHEFAKALWGEPKCICGANAIGSHSILFGSGIHSTASIGGWQYHLQQMVIAPNPIEYLGENI